MYLKRQKAPNTWIVPRKGTKYIVRPGFNMDHGVPVLVVLRDMLKVAQNRREVKRALHEKNVLLNLKPVTDDKNSVLLFDVLTIVPSKENYRMEITPKGKFYLKEISEKGAFMKTTKVVDKKTLSGKRTQLNLLDGRNFISDIECNTGDSVLINFKDKKIERCLPFKEGSNAVVIAGKHSGKEGLIESIDKMKKTVEFSSEGEKINVLIKQIMAVEVTR